MIDRMNTGEMDFATTQVVVQSSINTPTTAVMKKCQRRDSMTGEVYFFKMSSSSIAYYVVEPNYTGNIQIVNVNFGVIGM